MTDKETNRTGNTQSRFLTRDDLRAGVVIEIPAGAAASLRKPFKLLITRAPAETFTDSRLESLAIGWVLRMDGSRATSRKNVRYTLINPAECTLVSASLTDGAAAPPIWLVSSTNGPTLGWHAVPAGTDPTELPPKRGSTRPTTRRTTAVCGLDDWYFSPSCAGLFGGLWRCQACCQATGTPQGYADPHNISTLTALAEQLGLKPADLCNLVYDAAASHATHINNGGDLAEQIEFLVEVLGFEDTRTLLEYHRTTAPDTPETVPCKFCGQSADKTIAHRHDGGWVGDECCWDERLRATE